jgi:hypothetical protein
LDIVLAMRVSVLALDSVFDTGLATVLDAFQTANELAALSGLSSTRDPKFQTMRFDPKEYQAQAVKAGTIMDVSDVSLDKFRAKGGKIIMTHGTADDFNTPHNSIAYYKRQVANFGQARLDSFMRFYVVPGLGHGLTRRARSSRTSTGPYGSNHPC